MTARNFDACLSRLLKHEGGYGNHPSDPGGPTNYGITLTDYRKYINPNGSAADVRAMSREQAKAIYRARYWDALRCDELPAGIDYAVFDYGVNSGIGRSGKILRKALGLPVHISAVTDAVIKEAGKADAKRIAAAICDERLAFLKRLKTWPVFGKGWQRRVVEVRAFSLELADSATPPPPDIEKPEPEAPEPRKSAVKSKSIWAAIGTFIASIAGAATDWKVVAVLVVGALVGFLIWERMKRPDILGIFR